jgi:hypothetical protein
MLLAFFMVLNSLSKFEESEYTPIMRSLDGAFSIRNAYENEYNPSVAEANEQELEEGNVPEKLKALFNSIIPQNKIIENELKGTLFVTVSWKDFEKAVMDISTMNDEKDPFYAMQMGDEFFLPALVALLRSDEAGLPYHMDVILNIKQEPSRLQSKEPGKLAHIIRKMGNVSGQLEEAGLPPKLLNVGIRKGKINTVNMYFRPYVPFNPLGTDNPLSEDY